MGGLILCYNHQCNTPSVKESLSLDVDCSSSACPAACSCTKDTCSEHLSKCMDDSQCAAAWGSCFQSCACGDTTCALQCASASQAAHMGGLILCYNHQCNNPSLV